MTEKKGPTHSNTAERNTPNSETRFVSQATQGSHKRVQAVLAGKYKGVLMALQSPAMLPTCTRHPFCVLELQ